MATTQNIAAFRAAWDAAMQVYDTAHGAVGTDDILGATLFDMNSTVHAPAGLWDPVGGAAPDLVHNSDVPIFWTDGTDVIGPLSYDDFANVNKVEAVLNGYFGTNWKLWRLLTHVLAAMTTAGCTVTDVGTGPWTQADYNTFVEDLEGRFAVCSDPEGLELPGTMG